MKIVKLVNCKGANRFGTCLVCGNNSDEDKTLARFTIDCTSICLCEYHLLQLQNMIANHLS